MDTGAKRIRNLPPQTTPFYGRQEELAEIIDRLLDPACRLLTLVGPGGIGKTRLAIQAVLKLPVEFANGVAFIWLHPVRIAENLVYAIADGLNLPVTDLDNPAGQLTDYLNGREALIVLDNFDHLLDNTAVELVLRILHNAPQVKLLVASREVLNLQQEWVYAIQGLSLPPREGLIDLEASAAALLFIERARHVRRDFSQEQEAGDIARICHLTGGMPLALELAAAWARTMTCAAIANEVEGNIDFLAARMRDIPDRHRSLQAVFDHSWERLSTGEQKAFKRLSIFRGGFRLEAAVQVAGASLTVLTGLVDKSLLYFESSGRYYIHEVLRQFGEDKLHQDASDYGRSQELFSGYYLEFVNRRTEPLMGGRQRETMLEIETELENIRAAWKWIAADESVDGMAQFAMTMSIFYQYGSRYLEGLAMLELGAERLSQQPASRRRDLSLASLQCDISWLLIRLGQLEKAQDSAQNSFALVQMHNLPPSEAQGLHPLLPLGIIASIRGEYAESARLAEVVRQESENPPHLWNQQFAYYLLTRAALLQGDLENAHRYAKKTYAITRENQDDWFLGYCHTELGNVAREMGDRAAARQHYQASFDLRRDFDDPEGMAAALTNLGFIDLLDEDYHTAGEQFHSAAKIYREIHDKGGLATCFHGIARVAAAQSDIQTARQSYRQALLVCSEIQYYSRCTAILMDIGQLMLEAGNTEPGLEVLARVASHPASEPETRERAVKLLAGTQPTLPVGETDLDGLVARLLASFPELGAARALHPAASHPAQSLIDPLTERELEVLREIARGLTNQQIAAELFISLGTAKWYSSQIFRKLGVKNRTQAVARARELGLIGR